MKTPIETIADLPPIITFLSSHYELGFSFPLSVGIFVNGKSHSFLINPKDQWLQLEFDQKFSGGKPLSFFLKEGVAPEAIKIIIEMLTDKSEFLFYLRDDYDPRFLEMLGLDSANARDVALIDSFISYDKRHTEIIRRISQQRLNMYSVEYVVVTLAEQTFDNLKYDNLDDINLNCRSFKPIG